MEQKKDVLKEQYNEIMKLYRQNEVMKANELLQDFLAKASELKEDYYYAVGLNFLGVLQSAMGNVQRAVDYYFETMLYGEKHHIYEILPAAYNNIGSRYLDTGAYETALRYLKKADGYSVEIKETEHVSIEIQRHRKVLICVNIALAYTNLKEYNLSEQYLNQVEKLMENDPVQDMGFASSFLHCQNHYYMGDSQYVTEHLDFLLDGMEELVSLYSYEQNITEMFDFLIRLKENERIQNLLETVESFAKKRPESHYRLLSCKMRAEYEKNFGTKESYEESCVQLVEVYKEKERDTLREREEYMNLRMEMKITEDKRNEEEIRQKKLLTEALQEAEKANRAKTEFLSKMSHEIRTPLNAVIGYIDMAQNNIEDVKKLDTYHKKSQIAAKHLLSIINDVLDLSAIASGHFKIEYRAFDLKLIIGDINTIFRQQAVEKGIDFSIDLKKLNEEILIGDSMRVKQILLNLLSNAIKFTPTKGKIKLDIEQTKLKSEKKKVKMKFSVSDSGIGMTKEFMEKMFTPFEQQDASISRKYGGTGLGLSISKQLAEMMGGEMSVESVEQVGSTFIVTIPFEVASAEEEIELAGFDFSKMKALIIDNEKESREYEKYLLKRLKIKPNLVEDGQRALRQLKLRKGGEYEYNLCIIVDSLEDRKTIELIQEIRENFQKISILFLTSYITTELVENAKAAGANLVVEKPLFQSTLVDFIMEQYGKRQETSQISPVKVDFTGVKVLLAEDNEMNMEIAEDLLMRANLKIDKAFNGREAWQKFVNSPSGTYQAILMDIQMPEMDGYQATRGIRSSDHPQAATIPIIALTANAFNEDVQRALDSGMNGHIAKPINIQALYQMLGKILKMRE